MWESFIVSFFFGPMLILVIRLLFMCPMFARKKRDVSDLGRPFYEAHFLH